MDARERAAKSRRLRLDGIDPIQARQHDRTKERLEAAKAVTFRDCADSYIKAHEAGWSNAKHRYQWRQTMDIASETFGELPVANVDIGLVLKVLEPIWPEKPETASRLRQRLEAVIDWATARGFRLGENPARWKGHLDKLLPKPCKLRAKQHHPALPYVDVPSFMLELRANPTVSARALEFLIFTASRTGEVLNASWIEIDLKAKVWTIPAERMKGRKEQHRVPLCHRALEILSGLPREKDNRFVFVGGTAGKALHSTAMLELLETMRPGLTVHGFRSSFRDWAAEQTIHAREIAEKALAHTVRGVEGDYQRGDLFEKRRRLMADWERFCSQKPVVGGEDNVVGIRGRKRA